MDDISGVLTKLVAAYREQNIAIATLPGAQQDQQLAAYVTKSIKLADDLESRIPAIVANPSVITRDPTLKTDLIESTKAARTPA